jgi:hypothetical protein
MTPGDVFIDQDGNVYATRCSCPMHRGWPKKGHDASPRRSDQLVSRPDQLVRSSDEAAPKDGPDTDSLTFAATSATPEAAT